MMIYSQFDQFLKEVLKLPVAVFEGPSFSYTEQTARTCFAQQVDKTLLFTFYSLISVVDFFFWKIAATVIHSLIWLCYNLCVLLQKQVSLNMFLDTFMSDPPPQCLVWLPLMHRLANVENGEVFVYNLLRSKYLDTL